MASSSRLIRRLVVGSGRSAFHTSSRCQKLTEFTMPAMSPTMSSGAIASWKVKDGDKFSAGDVLLSVETDKAEVDVEAQDDGVMGKIFAGDGEKDIPVGKVIAMLAEEGDDISNVEAPKEGQKQSSSSEPPREEKESSASSFSSSSSSPTESNCAPSSSTSKTSSSTAQHSPSSSKESEDFIPAHPHPLSPSVLTLLIANGIKDASDIKGTGKNGMLIKGDVLVALGKIKDPMGSARKLVKEGGEKEGEAKKAEKKVDTTPLDGPSLRRLITSGLSHPPTKPSPVVRDLPQWSSSAAFDSILAGYDFSAAAKPSSSEKKGEAIPSKPVKVDALPLGRDDPFRDVIAGL